LAHVVCLPRALSTSPDSPDRSPCVFTRHHLGTDGRARVDAANVPPSLLVHRRSDHEPARPRESPGVRETGLSRSKKNARACQSPSGGEPRIDLDLIRRAEAEGLPETCREALTSAGGLLMSRRDDTGVLPPSNEGRWALRAYRRPQLASALLG
jgi:hypothetical protein